MCFNPAPAQGGAPCKGDANNIEACLVRQCPGKLIGTSCVEIYDKEI